MCIIYTIAALLTHPVCLTIVENGRAFSVQFNHINILCFNVEGVHLRLFMGWVDWIDNILLEIIFVIKRKISVVIKKSFQPTLKKQLLYKMHRR
jgi:hypothetical protein